MANIAAGSGMMLIGIAALLVSKTTVFPGAWGLLPTIGTALILWAGSQAWINTSLLSCRLVVALGLISYPLYLWHWVLISYARILFGSEASLPARLLLLFF